ncbi:MAG TPA: hypothetical protein VEX15_23530 [Nocardioidaceae bacterium]|nr:hypothetical protein [Nocardioidaceae bacterium]
MYEIDFLPVRRRYGDAALGPCAIAVRLMVESEDRRAIVVLGGGDLESGLDVVDHIRRYYDSDTVDLVIATRPDARHLEGLAAVLEQLEVVEVLVHQPQTHDPDASRQLDLAALERLLAVARDEGTTVTEPFSGVTRLDGQVAILGPPKSYYQRLLAEIGDSGSTGSRTAKLDDAFPSTTLHTKAAGLFERTLSRLHVETLTNAGEVSPIDNMSPVALLQVADHRLLFTGEAGVPALKHAADFFKSEYGGFARRPLRFFQPPHHGRAESLSPRILDRVLGKPGRPHGKHCVAFIATTAGDDAHPTPQVVNALERRACAVSATAGRAACHAFDAPPRPDWQSLPPSSTG